MDVGKGRKVIRVSRKNAGTAVAAFGYFSVAASGILIISHLSAHPSSVPATPPVIAAPTTPLPTPGHSVVPVKTHITPKRPVARDRVVSVSATVRRIPAESHGGVLADKPAPTVPTHKPIPKPTQPVEKCTGGTVLAVNLPIPVLPCDTLRVGKSISIGGSK